MIYRRKKTFTRKFKDLSATRRTLRNLDRTDSHAVSQALLENPGGELEEAQKLHAAVYLRRGFVDAADIEDGRLTHRADPHQRHALYFILKKTDSTGEPAVGATARQILYREDQGFLSFPLVEKADLNLQMLDEMVQHDPRQCVEISGLAKTADTSSSAILLLYRAMWQHSLKEGHQLWIMACDPRLYSRLKLLFGPAIRQIGRETRYPGGDVIPAMLNPQLALSQFIRISRRRAWMFGISRRQLISFFVAGLPREYIPAADLRHLDLILRK